MSIKLWAGFAAAVLSLAGAGPALAADLGQSPYGDPRYGNADRYAPPPQHYAEPYPDAYRPPYREHRPGPPAYGRYDRDDDEREYAERCVPRELIREQLRRQGWRNFEDIDVEDRFVLVRARDWNGNVVDLRLDRCSGRVLQSRIVERGERHPADYAWRPRRGYPPY